MPARRYRIHRRMNHLPRRTPRSSHICKKKTKTGWLRYIPSEIQQYIYRPRSEASKGYVFTSVCLSIQVLYGGKQTDATAIDFHPIVDRLTNELRDFKVQWQWHLSVYHYGWAVRILLECILVLEEEHTSLSFCL